MNLTKLFVNILFLSLFSLLSKAFECQLQILSSQKFILKSWSLLKYLEEFIIHKQSCLIIYIPNYTVFYNITKTISKFWSDFGIFYTNHIFYNWVSHRKLGKTLALVSLRKFPYENLAEIWTKHSEAFTMGKELNSIALYTQNFLPFAQENICNFEEFARKPQVLPLHSSLHYHEIPLLFPRWTLLISRRRS